MNRLAHIPGAGGWTAAALVAAPLLLAACVARPGGTYGPPPQRTPPPQRQPERVMVVEPPRADFSGDWELSGRTSGNTVVNFSGQPEWIGRLKSR